MRGSRVDLRWIKTCVSVCLLGLFFALTSTASAVINEELPFFGSLKDSSGNPLTGSYDMTFRLYDAASGGTTLATSVHTVANGNPVVVVNGEFAVLIGSGAGNSLGVVDFNTDSLYIRSNGGSDSEMTPRTQLGAAPFAFNAAALDGYTASDFIRGNGTTSILAASTDTLFTVTQTGGGDILNLFESGTEVLTVANEGSLGIFDESPDFAFEIATTTAEGYLAVSSAAANDGDLFIVDSTGSVGIGTSSPSALLDVWGSVRVGTSGTPTLFVDTAQDRIGVGTTTPTDKLTVDGSFAAGTSTLRLIDDGGQVCDVRAYGAIGDNATDNSAAIAAAIAGCPEGSTVYFPMGEYRITEPIVLDRPVTLRGAYSPRWSYASTPRSSIRADFGSFSGVALVHVRDRTISGEAEDNNGGRLIDLSLDGGSASVNVKGIFFEGLVRDWKLIDVDISQVTGNGFEAAVGSGSGNPRGFTIRGLSIYSADGHGFRATALNDSYLEDVLAVANALRGFYLSSMGETKVNNARAAFNALEGLYIDGSSNNGGLQFTDFSTDRNDRHGVRISQTGTTTVSFNGLLTRRDGANLGGGAETPYAGVAVIGTTTVDAAPVLITNLTQLVGVDDENNPPFAPSVGVRVANAAYVKVDGQLWGIDNAYLDGGGNKNFIIAEDAIVKTGTNLGSETPLFNNKWIASSTAGLIYDGPIHIGSSTNNRLLNIVAPQDAGARFVDTTNNVIFDMRAEDFQGFFGTFSNHQLRFQTNNTSRLTIDTDGDIGIGTTSPSAQLHTTGTVRLENFGAGTLQTDADGNVSVSSDERLKTVLGTYEAGLDSLLEIDPIVYRWSDASGYETNTLYAGFSAQNVAEFIPEAVGEDKRGFLTLSDRPILAAVVTAIQEIWEMITLTNTVLDTQTTELRALEAEVSEQAARIEALELKLEQASTTETLATEEVEEEKETPPESEPETPEVSTVEPTEDENAPATEPSVTASTSATSSEELTEEVLVDTNTASSSEPVNPPDEPTEVDEALLSDTESVEEETELTPIEPVVTEESVPEEAPTEPEPTEVPEGLDEIVE